MRKLIDATIKLAAHYHDADEQPIGKDLDLCPPHARLGERQAELPGVG